MNETLPNGTDPLIPTIFHEPWWLELASQGLYCFIEVANDQGKVVGRMPYQLNETLGIKRGVMPQFTHFLGPAIDEGLGQPDTRFLKRIAITRELLQKLPPMTSFSIKCHRNIKDTIAFQIEGFRTSVQFTHEIKPEPHDVLWATMHHKKRSVITRAQKRVSVHSDIQPQEFRAFYQKNLDEKKIKSILDLSVCEKLIATSQEKKVGRVWGARSPMGELEAAIFCVWDASACYYLMTTRKSGTHTGLISLLVWEAIKDATSRGLVFDFDGLISEGSVMFSTDFGAQISPRYIVTRDSPSMKLYKTVRSFFQKENCFG